MFTVGLNNLSNREQWLEATLKSLPAGLTILDAGAGECPYKKWCSHLNYISQDFGQYEGTCEDGLQTGSWDNTKLDIVSDIIAIPLGDASVDVIMCTEVFEHIPNPLDALKEFQRLLKPGGYLILTSPFVSFTHFAPYHFSSGFSRFYYQHHLPNFGFEINQIELSGNFFDFVAQENRRIKWVADKYLGKKINLFEKIIIHLNLWVLQKYAKQDKSSQDLVCYGIHVLARKKA